MFGCIMSTNSTNKSASEILMIIESNIILFYYSDNKKSIALSWFYQLFWLTSSVIVDFSFVQLIATHCNSLQPAVHLMTRRDGTELEH